MDAFDYLLPENKIAQSPVEPRSSARMLVGLEPEGALDATVGDLASFLSPGDLLVLNETRVLRARLQLEKVTGGHVELLLLEPLCDEDDPTTATRWTALVRPGRRVPPGTDLFEAGQKVATAQDVLPGEEGRRIVVLDDPGILTRAGEVPLPPYIHEPLADPERYQTVYARTPGSVAAPTAGLHLTTEVLDSCVAAGAQLARVELMVGMDTFRPITAERPEDHVMHSERYRVPEEVLRACRDAKRVVAVGTTTVRALEAAASSSNSSGRTSLFIREPFDFEVVDVLLTNFHLPRSSLLLLVDAFYGPAWRGLYSTALDRGYRFLSFGDAMLLGRDAGRGGGRTPSSTKVHR